MEAKHEIFQSSVRATGDLAGVFEYDGETGYFYLYSTSQSGGRKVLGALHVFAGRPDFRQADVDIRWDATETLVGLFIRHQIWAAFDTTSGDGYSGNYAARAPPELPSRISEALAPR